MYLITRVDFVSQVAALKHLPLNCIILKWLLRLYQKGIDLTLTVIFSRFPVDASNPLYHLPHHRKSSLASSRHKSRSMDAATIDIHSEPLLAFKSRRFCDQNSYQRLEGSYDGIYELWPSPMLFLVERGQFLEFSVHDMGVIPDFQCWVSWWVLWLRWTERHSVCFQWNSSVL